MDSTSASTAKAEWLEAVAKVLQIHRFAEVKMGGDGILIELSDGRKLIFKKGKEIPMETG